MKKVFGLMAVILGILILVGAKSEKIYPWPVDPSKYSITKAWANSDPNRGHSGVDINTPAGVPVYAPVSGILNYYYCSNDGGKTLTSYGNLAEIVTDTNVFKFAHLDSFEFEVDTPLGNDKTGIQGGSAYLIQGGISISQGTCIGYTGHSGNTGGVTGNHLHLEIVQGTNRNGSRLNPVNWFDETQYAEGKTPPPADNCTDDYAGTYQCVTQSSPLKIRAGHGTQYGIRGEIPSGAIVHVTLGDGKWAHVIYDGVEGFSSMEYLRLVSNSGLINVGPNLIGFSNGDVFNTSGTESEAGRAFADFCQNLLFGMSYTKFKKGFQTFERNGEDNPSWYGNDYGYDLLINESVVTTLSGKTYVVSEKDDLFVRLVYISRESGQNIVRDTTKTKAQAVSLFTEDRIERIELWGYTGLDEDYQDDNEVFVTLDVDPTAYLPDIIVHIDNPNGTYDGSNHIEISGWIAARYEITYVMGECEAFGQINLSDTLTDASEELDSAGYGRYTFKKRYHGVIDRKYLKPNTTYTMKVWAGMSNNETSGICGEEFFVSYTDSTVITFTKGGGSFTGARDIEVAGYVRSINPIEVITGCIKDFSNDAARQADISLTVQEDPTHVSEAYPYAKSFSGSVPLSAIGASGITASHYITAAGINGIETTEAVTFSIGNIVKGNIDDYKVVYDIDINNFDIIDINENKWDSVIQGTIHAHAPIAAVQYQVYKINGGVAQTYSPRYLLKRTPDSGYDYAALFSGTVNAGDLENNSEYKVLIWATLVQDNGHGKQASFYGEQKKIITRTVSRKQYTISYDANGGIGAPASQTKTYGRSLTLRTEVPTRIGYTFTGWAAKRDAKTVQYMPGGNYDISNQLESDQTLYAVWEEAELIPSDLIKIPLTAQFSVPNAVKVYRFIPSGTTRYQFKAEGANVTVTDESGEPILSVSSDTVAEGDVLLEGHQIYYINIRKTETNPDGNARVMIARGFRIKLIADGEVFDLLYQYAGSAAVIPETVPDDKNLVVSAILEEGELENNVWQYTVEFDGWCIAGNVWYPEEEIRVNRDITLYAQWNYPAYGALPNPEHNGYVFLGWEDASGLIITGSEKVRQSGNLIALWEEEIPIEEIIVTPSELHMYPGQRMTFDLQIIPENASYQDEIIYRIFDNKTDIIGLGPQETVVSDNNMITAKAKGVDLVVIEVHGIPRKMIIVRVSDRVFDTYILPDQLVKIEEEAFSGSNAEKIVLPETCAAIGKRAFADCMRLEYLVISRNTISISPDAFEGSTKLTIIAPSDSYAAFFAHQHGIPFAEE